MDQLRALVALFPEMLQARDDAISVIIRGRRVGMDVLCGYEHRIFPRHTRREVRAHKSNKLFEVIASIASIIRHRDLLHGMIRNPIWG